MYRIIKFTGLYLILCNLAIAAEPFVKITDKNSRFHSGVVIESGETIKVLTCSHMLHLGGVEPLNVSFYTGDTYIGLPAEIEKSHFDRDLMLLSIKNIANIEVEPIPIAEKIENINCVIKGHTSSIVNSNTVMIKKTVSANYDPRISSHKGFELSIFNGTAVSGLSGSGILSNGKIVSIQSSGSNNLISGSNIKEIRDFLLGK